MTNVLKGNKIGQATLAQDVAAAKVAHTAELFEEQQAGRLRMMDLFDSAKPLPPAPDADERGYGVSTAPAETVAPPK
jgi:tripartite-type tricarboxylate transporter receptor subunit TctC